MKLPIDPRQEVTMYEILKAGGTVYVIDGDTSELEHFLKENLNGMD